MTSVPDELIPRTATAEERRAALGLLFTHLSPGEREYRVARVLELIDSRALDPAGLLIVPVPGGLDGVIISQVVPGAAALIWPPVVVGTNPGQKEDGLVQLACERMRRQGTRLAQCLLGDNELYLAGPLLRHGFRHVTGLTYLRHGLHRLSPTGPEEASLQLAPYDACNPESFHATLLATYQGTLDCPEVNGTRTIEQVIEGHRAQSGIDLSRWWLVEREGKALGILIVTEPVRGEWEISYMGIIAGARRQGYGRALLNRILRLAREGGAIQMVLSVDDRNLPACRLYEGMGFESYDHRQVLLAIWSDSAISAGAPPPI